MTNLEALLCLHAAQGWLWLPLTPDGRTYGPGFFRKRDWLSALYSMKGNNRRVAKRLMEHKHCLRCSGEILATSTGDHLVPRAKGGPDGAVNYLPLCKTCNLSKGKKDLFAWWPLEDMMASVSKEILRDVLCAYARLMLFVFENNRELRNEADEVLRCTVCALHALMPSMDHWEALMETTGKQVEQSHAETTGTL